MPPIPVEADAPPDLVTPLTASAGGFGFAGAAFEFGGRRDLGIEQIEIGEIARQQRRIGEADIFVVGRDARHRDRALGKLGDAVAADVVGRDHRLALSDQHAQSDIVAFRALGFLDACRRALRRLAKRRAPRPHRRHRRRRAWRPRPGAAPACSARIDRTDRRWRLSMKAAMQRMVKRSRTKSRGLKRRIGRSRRGCKSATHEMCPIYADFKHFRGAKAKEFRHRCKVSSIM